jgi:hypothetical protein
MSNLKSFAEQELDAIGMTDEDEMNGAMRKHILHMIKEFSQEGHSGFSASYAIGILTKLLKYEPLSPLTGEDSEWVDVAEQSGGTLYQNKRCSRVFKDPNSVYDIDGKVFYEWATDEDGTKYKNYFTNIESRVPVTFPYTPTIVYEEYVDANI